MQSQTDVSIDRALSRFQDKAEANRALAMAMEAQDRADAASLAERKRQERIARTRNEHEYLAEWQEKGIEQWAFNMEVARERVMRGKKFAKTMKRKKESTVGRWQSERGGRERVKKKEERKNERKKERKKERSETLNFIHPQRKRAFEKDQNIAKTQIDAFARKNVPVAPLPVANIDEQKIKAHASEDSESFNRRLAAQLAESDLLSETKEQRQAGDFEDMAKIRRKQYIKNMVVNERWVLLVLHASTLGSSSTELCFPYTSGHGGEEDLSTNSTSIERHRRRRREKRSCSTWSQERACQRWTFALTRRQLRNTPRSSPQTDHFAKSSTPIVPRPTRLMLSKGKALSTRRSYGPTLRTFRSGCCVCFQLEVRMRS